MKQQSLFFTRVKKNLYKVKSFLTLLPNYLYDIIRYVQYSIMGGHPRNLIQFEALLTRDYHKLEKSISFKDFKPYSGKDTIAKIFINIDLFGKKYGLTPSVKSALTTIEQYILHHKNLGHSNQFIEDLELKVKEVEKRFETYDWDKGGTLTRTKKEILKSSSIDAHNFFYSRHSLREFSDQPIDVSVIEKVFEHAVKTPSVCNRQGWKAYYVSDPKILPTILQIQGGNRGFDHLIKNLIIVTGDLNHFNGSNERNQVWVDGGMFAMSIVYALHAEGVASCCLNWAASASKDRKLRKAFPALKKHESVIMMIAVGNYPEKFTVCQSPRKDIAQILEII